MDRARPLLETSGLPVDLVAKESGFASIVTFRQRFAAAYSTTPTSYRKRFAQPGLRSAPGGQSSQSRAPEPSSVR